MIVVKKNEDNEKLGCSTVAVLTMVEWGLFDKESFLSVVNELTKYVHPTVLS